MRLNSIFFLTLFVVVVVPKIWSTEKGKFNLDLRYVTAFEIKMRALNSMDNENLVYGYCWFQTMLSKWKKNSNASERIAFSCNKWLALNLIIFFATKTMGAFAARKNPCVLQLESLTFSEACLCFSIEINGMKGHIVKMFECNNLSPRQRQIPFSFQGKN